MRAPTVARGDVEQAGGEPLVVEEHAWRDELRFDGRARLVGLGSDHTLELAGVHDVVAFDERADRWDRGIAGAEAVEQLIAPTGGPARGDRPPVASRVLYAEVARAGFAARACPIAQLHLREIARQERLRRALERFVEGRLDATTLRNLFEFDLVVCVAAAARAQHPRGQSVPPRTHRPETEQASIQTSALAASLSVNRAFIHGMKLD